MTTEIEAELRAWAVSFGSDMSTEDFARLLVIVDGAVAKAKAE